MWFREDVMRILASTHETMQASLRASAGGGQGAEAYEQGFADALRVVALAFGLSLQPGRSTSQHTLSEAGEERLPGGRVIKLDSPREWRG